MANEAAWEDRRIIVNIDEGWKKCCTDIMHLFETAQKLKDEVLDDSVRAAELKKILDEMPGWSLSNLQDRYTKIKTAHDFVMALEE